MRFRTLRLSAILAAASSPAAFGLTTAYINFDNQPALLTNPISSDPEQTITVPGVATITGGVVGNETTNLNGTYVTAPNAYGTADTGQGAPNPTNPLTATLTIAISPSYTVDEVSLPIFNGAPFVISYQVNAYSGNTLVGAQTVNNVPAINPSLGAADPNVGVASVTGSNITSVTIAPTTFPNGRWDYIIDSIAFNQAVVPSLIWDNAGGASPSDGATWDINHNNNWNNSAAPAIYTDGAAVTFNDSNNSHYAVTLNTTVNPASTTFINSAGNYTISGSGGIGGNGPLTKSDTSTVTLSTSNSYTGGTTVTAGLLEISRTSATTSALPKGAVTITGGELQLATNVTLGSQSSPTPASNVNITSLSITGTGTLDINNNHIIIDYAPGNDPIASITAWIKTAYNAGAWTGTGITSSAAQLNAASYGIGYADSADPGNPAGLASGQIEIMYTLLGDANLDGAVNGSDFAILAANFNKADLSGHSGWDEGDFNYDGSINGSDFATLAANFNKGSSQSADSQADLAALDPFVADNGLISELPEPGAMGVLAVATFGEFSRRRRLKSSAIE